jgi:DNA (cytosine-5)-methyltransferase 1
MRPPPLRFLSLFAGIGGFDLGLEKAGHECVGQIEIDLFCRRVLARRFRRSPGWSDVREWPRLGNESATDRQLAWDYAGGVDLLCGGFPCQDLSVAGKRAGLGGARSGLFWEIVRIAKITRPTWGLFENVPGLLSSGRGADMSSVLAGLRECWPVVGYRILDSRYFGVAQRRRRVFFVCGPTEAGVASVLFEPEGGGGHPAKGHEAGAGIAASLTSGVGAASNDPGRRREDDVNLVCARPLTGTMFKGHDEDTDTLIAATLNPGHEAKHSYPGDGGTYNLVTHALSSEGADASEDGTGRGTPMVVATLNSGGNDGGFRTEPGEHLIARPLKGGGNSRHDESHQTFPHGVRRLTPLECERLQGFPDGWTCLCIDDEVYRFEPDRAASLCKCPDSPRYRALGNAVTVNVIKWIGKRLAA